MKRAIHVKLTERQFRKLKREEYSVAWRAMEDLLSGAAYLPEEAKQAVVIAHTALQSVGAAISYKAWP